MNLFIFNTDHSHKRPKVYYILLILFFGLCQILNAQEFKKDSSYPLQNLKKELKVDQKGDILISIARYHIDNGSLDSCQFYAKRALKIGLKDGRRDIAQKAYWYLGRSDFLKFDFGSALSYMEKAENIYLENPDTLALIKIINTKGLSLRNLGKIEESIDAFKSGLAMAEKRGDQRLITIYSINLGASYKTLKANEQAINYYNKALAIAEKEKDSLHLGIVLTNIGNIYSSITEYDKTRLYYKKALDIHKATNNYSDQAMIWANLSHIDLQEKNYDRAIDHAQNSLEIADSTFVQLGAIIVSHANLAEAFLRKKEFDDSRFHLDKAKQLSLDNKVPGWLEEIYNLNAELEAEVGNFQEAFTSLKKVVAIRDSVANSSLIHKLNLEETQTELDEKKKEISLLEEDNSIQEKENKSLRIWFAIGILILLFFTTIIYIYFLRQKSIGLALRKEAAENKLEALRNQINPHFLFNSFNAIQHYILKSEKDKAYDYLTRVAFLIRKVLDNAPSMTIDLKDELEVLKKYVQLEALRFKDKFTYDFEVQEELIELNPTIPSMIIQPYIENAILHGLSNKENSEGKLKVGFSILEGNRIRCLIQDNGIGRDKAMKIKAAKAENQNRDSIAMNNTNKRLQILEKAGYPPGKVQIIDLKDEKNNALGTKVVVELSMI